LIDNGNSIFSTDSKLTKSFTGVYNLFILNILFLIGCLPIVTIGIAQSSLYASMLEIKSGSSKAPSKIFFQALQKNWKKGLFIGLIELTAAVVLYADLIIIETGEGQIFLLFKALCYGGGLVLLIIFLYLIPMSIKFDQSIKVLFKKSFLMACLNLPGSFFLAGIVLVMSQLFQATIVMMMAMVSVFLVLGFSVFTCVQLLIVERFLKKYE
jgi:uncharacterized membrane protein YesL